MLKKSLLNGCNNMSQYIQLITTTTTTNTTKTVIINSHLKPQASKKSRAPDASEAFFKSRRSCKWARFFFFLFYSENPVHILHSLWHKNVLLNKSKIVKPKVHTHTYTLSMNFKISLLFTKQVVCIICISEEWQLSTACGFFKRCSCSCSEQKKNSLMLGF